MGTVTHEFFPSSAQPLASTNYPALLNKAGSAFPQEVLAFDATTDESCFFKFNATNYGSGDLTLRIRWYADTGSSANVVWGAAIAAITPNTDTQDAETKAFGTANTVQDTHLGTTAQRLHEAVITITNTDSIAAGDEVALKLYRDADGTAATDDFAGDANVTSVILEYSDT